MKYARHLIWGGVTLLAGCAALPSALTSAGHATLRIVPQVVEGRTVQTVNTGYRASDIHHFKVELDKLVGGIPQQQPIVATGEGSAADKGLTIDKLAAGASYRLTAYAYLDTGALISDPASSSVDVAVPTNNDDAGQTTIPVALVNKLFNGTATGSIALTEGQYLSPGDIQTKFGMLVSAFVGGGAANADGSGALAGLNGPLGIGRATSQSDFFVADYYGHRIRQLTPAGVVSTFAGSGTAGNGDAVGLAATFNRPLALTVDATGTIYVSQDSQGLLRKITPGGTVTTFAGNATPGNLDGTGLAARFGTIYSLTVDPQGNIYGADYTSQKIRKFTSAGVMTTLVSSGLTGPAGITCAQDGTLYVADSSAHVIYKVSPQGALTPFAGSGTSGTIDGVGTSAKFSSPNALTLLKDGSLLVSQNNGYLRLVSPAGKVSTVAGNGSQGIQDGRGSDARVGLSYGLAPLPNGGALMTEFLNYRIRTVSF
jgi:sugar lactone lactonase YvrE